MKSQRSKMIIIENNTFQYTYRLIKMIGDKYRSKRHDFRINSIRKQFWVLLGALK